MKKNANTKVKVRLKGTNGNGFAILNRVSIALKRAKRIKDAENFMCEACNGNLLDICAKYADIL